jgi:hypothetical protein
MNPVLYVEAATLPTFYNLIIALRAEPAFGDWCRQCRLGIARAGNEAI